MVLEIIVIVSFSTVFGGILLYRNCNVKPEGGDTKKKLLMTCS